MNSIFALNIYELNTPDMKCICHSVKNMLQLFYLALWIVTNNFQKHGLDLESIQQSRGWQLHGRDRTGYFVFSQIVKHNIKIIIFQRLRADVARTNHNSADRSVVDHNGPPIRASRVRSVCAPTTINASKGIHKEIHRTLSGRRQMLPTRRTAASDI